MRKKKVYNKLKIDTSKLLKEYTDRGGLITRLPHGPQDIHTPNIDALEKFYNQILKGRGQ